MRYFFEISYKGTNYHGWQLQKNAPSVQEVINKALQTILKIPVETLGSSRTDAGVHAKQQFFQADLPKIRDRAKLKFKLNSFLPKDIAVLDIRRTVETANCRFDATSRSYEYHISKVKNPFLIETAIEIKKNLDVDKMNKAAAYLKGRQDFKSFCKNSGAVPGHMCDLKKANWIVKGNDLIFHIRANRFLRGMVRAIVGTLLLVGEGSMSVKEFIKILKAKDRTKAGPAAPAKGLTLSKVRYPERLFVDNSC